RMSGGRGGSDPELHQLPATPEGGVIQPRRRDAAIGSRCGCQGSSSKRSGNQGAGCRARRFGRQSELKPCPKGGRKISVSKRLINSFPGGSPVRRGSFRKPHSQPCSSRL